eukprot:TRINITY_DN535_c0_g1_i1.p1 TRINITY_DN535_c0_g1~~TRINITY_DN535_c0_g1_i1.p1  ORF type:complete len:401 (-),score=101.47 TRINITY_DN535_c0_g1_i1:106-1308(-)
MSIQFLANKAAEATRNQDGFSLLTLLENSEKQAAKLKNDPQLRKFSDVGDLFRNRVESPIDEIVSSHVKCIIAVQDENYEEAYTQQNHMVNAVLKGLGEDQSWLMKVFHYANRRLREIAGVADQILQSRGVKSEKLEDAARTLNNCFKITVTDRSTTESSRKWGLIEVINNLFKIYFKLNNFTLCKNLTKAVSAPGIPPLNQFPVSQFVTFKYFTGRLLLSDGHYKKAEEELMTAFERCSKHAFQNKRLILQYLLPVKLLYGKFPSKYLLQKYNLPQYMGLSEAVKCGNLTKFNEEMKRYQEFFIAKGVYLILEKLEMITHRNLFFRIYKIINKSLIEIQAFATALRWLGADSDLDEIECILANLIYKGYIKGNISHSRRILVLSKQNPFPKLSTIATSH